MRTRLMILTACVSLASVPLTRAAAANEFAPLIALARSPVEEYPQKRAEFLRQMSSRFDVEAAARAGWEAWLMAQITNVRFDHPAESQAWDEPPKLSRRHPDMPHGYGGTSTPFMRTLSIELLWKGAYLGPEDRERAGGKAFAPLPRYAQFEILNQFRRVSEIEGPTSLWLEVARSDAPGGLKGLAYWVLAQRDLSLFREFAFEVMGNTNSSPLETEMVLLGLIDHRPSYAWDVLYSTTNHWLRQAAYLGVTCVATVTNAEATRLLFQVMRDQQTDARIRYHALLGLVSGGENWVAIEGILRDQHAPQILRDTAAGFAPRQPVAKVRQFLEEFGVINLDAYGRNTLIAALKDKGGVEELSFLRRLSEQADLPGEVREAAAQAADEMSKRLK